MYVRSGCANNIHPLNCGQNGKNLEKSINFFSYLYLTVDIDTQNALYDIPQPTAALSSISQSCCPIIHSTSRGVQWDPTDHKRSEEESYLKMSSSHTENQRRVQQQLRHNHSSPIYLNFKTRKRQV